MDTARYAGEMSIRTAACLVLACSLVACCAAQPARSSDAQAPASDPFLDNLRGSWLIERHAHDKLIHNTLDCRWILQHQFIEMHMLDTASPPQYEATVLVGYDPDHDRYVAHWCDSFGPGVSSVGFGTRTGNSVEFRFQYNDGPFFNTFTWHPDSRTWTFRGENGQPDGSRKLFMEDTATRR